MNEWMNEWVKDWLTDWINEWMNEWLNDWLTDRLTDWIKEGMKKWMEQIARLMSWLDDELTHSISNKESAAISWILGSIWPWPPLLERDLPSVILGIHSEFTWFISRWSMSNQEFLVNFMKKISNYLELDIEFQCLTNPFTKYRNPFV